MTHDKFRELIQRELDGDATPQEQQLLEAHTATCDDCRRERDDYRQLAAAFGSLPKVMPEKSFVSMMEPELQKILKKKRRPAAYFWPILTAAAALVLAVGLNNPFGFFTQDETVSPPSQPDQVVQQLAVVDDPLPAAPADADKHPEPQLIQQEKVKEKPAVQLSAVSKNELGKVQDQTGVVVEQQKVDAITSAPDPAKSGVVVVTVDSKPTDVKVDGDNVTVIVAQDEQAAEEDGSNVSVWGIAGFEEGDSGEKTVTFTDENGNVIETSRVVLQPAAGPIPVDGPLNRSIANAFQAHPEQNEWARDPYQVIYRHLTDLGFSKDALVSQSNELNIVTVMQGAVTYRVRLMEAAQGYWHPVQISRLIHPHETDQLGQKVIAYFAAQKARGVIDGFGDIFMTERTAGTVKVSVAVEREDSGGVINVSEERYEFQVQKTASGDIRLGEGVTVHTNN